MKTDEQKLPNEDRGLRCFNCGCQAFRVIYTRRARGEKLVRRRECRDCGQRLTTWERAIGWPPP